MTEKKQKQDARVHCALVAQGSSANAFVSANRSIYSAQRFVSGSFRRARSLHGYCMRSKSVATVSSNRYLNYERSDVLRGIGHTHARGVPAKLRSRAQEFQKART